MKRGLAIALGMLVGMLFSPAGQGEMAKAAQEPVASLDYSYTNLYDTATETKSIDAKDPKKIVAGAKIDLDLAAKYGSKDAGYAFTKGSGTLYASLNGSGRRKLEWSGEQDKFQDSNGLVYAPVMTAGKKNVWDANNLPYFEAEFSTKGYENISFSVSIGATKKAPKSYRMAYRVGSSGSYTTLFYDSASLTLSKNKQFVSMSAKLPDTAADTDKVTVKIYATEAATVGGGILSDNPTRGKIGINHISVEGTQVKEQPASDKNQAAGEKTSVGKAAVSKATLQKKKVTISLKKMNGISGYQVQIASDKKIKKNVKSVSVKGRKAVFKKWKKKTCYVRVRAYKTDTKGKRVYGTWSAVKKVKKK